VTDTKWAHRKGDKKRVVVIGAGVAGMTAAHELVERGYEVEVVEMSAQPFNPTRPRIGGMARTSWARVLPPADPDQVVDKEPAAHHMVQLFTDHAPPPIEMKLTEIDSPDAQAFVRALRAMPARRKDTETRARGATAAGADKARAPDPVPVDRFQALFDEHGASTADWVDRDNSPALLSRDALVDANREHHKREQIEHGDDISRYLDFPLGDVEKHPDEGPLRYMCGIQFYFPADVRVILGHTVCLDSPWGVSYISQVQYWQDHIRDHSGVRGIFSAIFTLFEEASQGVVGKEPKTAMQCNADEIADRVWKQILDSWDESKFGELPRPEYYYLDESLRYDDKSGRWINDTPYLVNRVGDWDRRGGVRNPDGSYAYRMQLGHTVFAGAFMRTETRLNTMEAANESGRRAVNAILDHDRAPHQLCKLWNIEDHEIPEARPLRELDRRVCERGGRHVLRHTVFDAALRVVPWDLLRLVLPTREEQS
jgi:hypothetical protein